MSDTNSGSSSGSSAVKLRLKSVYAEDPADELLFEWDGGAHLDLMGTPFCENIDPSILMDLQRRGSVPAFLGYVTAELFEKQTLA